MIFEVVLIVKCGAFANVETLVPRCKGRRATSSFLMINDLSIYFYLRIYVSIYLHAYVFVDSLWSLFPTSMLFKCCVFP